LATSGTRSSLRSMLRGFTDVLEPNEEGIRVSAMRVVIIPSLMELRIKVNPTKKATREGLPHIVMPWMFAPWPEAKNKGVIETNIENPTLRGLLIELSCFYKKAGVDFEPINSKTNDVDFDYEILVNGNKYVGLPLALETKLENGNEVVVKMNMLWDG
jgi:hypothetical protein